MYTGFFPVKFINNPASFHNIWIGVVVKTDVSNTSLSNRAVVTYLWLANPLGVRGKKVSNRVFFVFAVL
jgi:hypothetical protein